jgi:Zn-dependent M32 family carboxypeptidase
MEVRDVPAAWDEGIDRLRGLELRGPVAGVPQDVHRGARILG